MAEDEKLREQVTDLIDSKKVSQLEFAKKADVTPQTLKNFIKGIRTGNGRSLRQIRKAFNTFNEDDKQLEESLANTSISEPETRAEQSTINNEKVVIAASSQGPLQAKAAPEIGISTTNFPPKRADDVDDGYVYVISYDPSLQIIKLGFSTEPLERLKVAQTHVGKAAKLVFQHRAKKRVETLAKAILQNGFGDAEKGCKGEDVFKISEQFAVETLLYAIKYADNEIKQLLSHKEVDGKADPPPGTPSTDTDICLQAPDSNGIIPRTLF